MQENNEKGKIKKYKEKLQKLSDPGCYKDDEMSVRNGELHSKCVA
jgi:hypothetical protein